MRDLNFFEPYIEKREFKFNRMYFLYLLLALCIIGVVILGIYNQVRISMLRNQIDDRREVAENPKTVKKYNEIKELEIEMTAFSEEVDKIVELDKNIEETDIISEDLLFDIRSKMPTDLFLTNLSVNGRDIQISGIAKDSYSVAELSKGLEFIKDIESVFVSSINNVEGDYNFVLNMTFKDVHMDGNETETVEE